MRRLIIFCIIIVLLLVGLFTYRQLPQEGKDTNLNEESIQLEAPLSLQTELTILSPGRSKALQIDEYEQHLFVEENLMSMAYLKYVDRLLYDYEQATNRMIFVYRDQTLLIDFNTDSYSLNGQAQGKNNLVVNKANTFYININTLSTLFDVEYFLVEEPMYSITVDFNSEQDALNTTEERINASVSSLPEYINMTWEAVYSRATDVDALYPMPGLDIISPVWYELTDGQGKFTDKTQEDYIDWAKAQGIRLWPAITNGFDTELTSTLINDIDLRTDYINALLEIYRSNGFNGINIDFENIYKEDREALSQFIAELTAAFHRSGIIVSMDVTFAGGSDTWSKCYDRLILGQWVDFVVVMSYDQHWGSSPISGTVAGVDWIEDNMKELTKEVDSNKIIMGIPFYMRVWFERPSGEHVNTMRVTSDAITMHRMEEILDEGEHTILWDDETGQSYISFIDTEAMAVKKIWIEDSKSLGLKIDLVHTYGLKGIASWCRGYELESIWPVLDDALRGN